MDDIQKQFVDPRGPNTTPNPLADVHTLAKIHQASLSHHVAGINAMLRNDMHTARHHQDVERTLATLHRTLRHGRVI
jgi:hypothetical protein